MADYQPLIARAVAGLSEAGPEMRQAVYDRARGALIEQLRSLDPPLSEADIARERLQLDDAIDRVEAQHRTAAPQPAPPEPEPDPVFPEPDRPSFRLPQPRAARAPQPTPEPAPPDEDAASRRERPRVETVPAHVTRDGRWRPIVLGVVLALVIGSIAVVAWLRQDEIPSGAAAPVAEAPRAPDGGAKIADRVSGDRPAAPPADPPRSNAAAPPPRNEVAVAQRAVLYEENAANPQQPRASAGRALWRLDTVNAGQGRPLETAVRVSVEAGEAAFGLTVLIRRNTDPTLPASHTVELTFTTGADATRVVRDVGLLQLKSEEAVRGTPVAGLPVPVKDNFFLIGLSNLPADEQRNRDLLLERNWIDLPLRFASGQRAILSFEKGVSGDQVLRNAFAQWGP